MDKFKRMRNSVIVWNIGLLLLVAVIIGFIGMSVKGCHERTINNGGYKATLLTIWEGK
ncbi:MAG: hypothetical protein GY718_14440 [Lentisphaerae bacterium]|nr:hypothetical protein [Lentisphaerota bacterium]